MTKLITAMATVLLLSSTWAIAQPSEGKGSPATTGETADPSKALGATSQDKVDTGSVKPVGSSLPSDNAARGAENKNGDGTMAKGVSKR
jgi:hypothetical protein